jgi:histidine triad (HIT) family protein
MQETVFSKIIRREISADIVYEDNQFLAILDINPVTKGHTLLMPKAEYVWFQDMSDDLFAALALKAKELATGIKQAVGCDYVELVIQGKEVPHVHIHLIPGMVNGKTAEWSHVSYDAGEAKEFAQKISESLSK